MKTLLVLLLLVSQASATEYYFRVDAQTNKVASFTSATVRPLNPTAGRVLITVTQAQYGTGTQADFDALPPAVITAGIAAAKEEEADFEEWNEKLKALAKLMRKEINLIRAAHGQPVYDVDEWKAKLKAEM